MPEPDKSQFFNQSENASALRDVASSVNEKHNGEVKRPRGRPRKIVGDNTAQVAGEDTKEAPAYIDPEIVRVGFTAIVRAVDSYIGKKFYHLVEAATQGDAGLAERFKEEAAISDELVKAYGEASVGIVKKYAFLLEYAPEGLMLSCIVADASIKFTVYNKIKELCHFVATNRPVNANTPQAN